MFSGKLRFLSICIDGYRRGHILKFFCFMKGKITVSENCHFTVSVKERITDCAIADTFSLKLTYSGNRWCSPSASCCKDHTDCIKISCRCLYCKCVKTFDSKHLCFNDPHAQSLCLYKSTLIKLFTGYRFFQSIIVFDFFCFCQCSDSIVDHYWIQITSGSI